MAFWILKEEPTVYSYHDLERDGATRWTGVHNALALRHLRAMRPKDRALYYHTGAERSCVGIVEVTSEPQPDPDDDRGSYRVDVRPVRALRRPIPLSEVRLDPALAGIALVRLPRLSVLPLSEDQWVRLLAHEDATPRPGPVLTPGAKGRGTTSVPRPRPTGARRRR